MTKKFEKTEEFFKKGKVKRIGGMGHFEKVVKTSVNRARDAAPRVRKLPARGYDR